MDSGSVRVEVSQTIIAPLLHFVRLVLMVPLRATCSGGFRSPCLPFCLRLRAAHTYKRPGIRGSGETPKANMIQTLRHSQFDTQTRGFGAFVATFPAGASWKR